MQLPGWPSAPKLLGIKVRDGHLVPVISPRITIIR